MTQQKTIAIIGPGNLGSGLIAALSKQHRVLVGARNPDKTAQTLSQLINSQLEVLNPISAAQKADIVLLTVNDESIEQLAKQLSPELKQDAVLAHCSGSLDSEILEHSSSQYYVASVHPLNTFPKPAQSIQLLNDPEHGSFVFCEGDEHALQLLIPIFESIYFTAHTISKKSKPLYHAAAVFACNYLVTLMDASLSTAELAKINRDDYWQAIQPMLKNTLHNIDQKGTEQSLSGPIARGDFDTVKKHIDLLRKNSDLLADHYTELSRLTRKVFDK